MHPVPFPEANTILGGGPGERWQLEHDVVDLPAYRGQGQIISRWCLSAADRIRVLAYGHVWVSVVSPTTSPPIALDTRRTLFTHPNDNGDPMDNLMQTPEQKRAALAILNDPNKTDVEKLAAIGVSMLREALEAELADINAKN